VFPKARVVTISECASHAVADAAIGGVAGKGADLRGPGRVLRSQSPDMVRQEIYGYLLTHFAISALICRAAAEADIDPDRVKFKRTVRIVRRRGADPAFSP
jgi:hypothetical protein